MANVNWKVATGLICAYGVFKDFRPSESFLTSYLVDPEGKNLTLAEVNNEIYPIWTYSYLVTLILVLLFTDLLRYKPIVILEAFSYMVTWSLLLFAYGVLNMQLMQFAYGWATATEIAYYSYIYAAVTDVYYRRVSGYIRASSLAGRCFAASLGQILVTFANVNYFNLNIISMTNVSIAFVISLTLPKVDVSFYFHRLTEQGPKNTNPTEIPTDKHDSVTSNNKVDLVHENNVDASPIENTTVSVTSDEKQSLLRDTYTRISFTDGLWFMWKDFRTAYTQKDIILWSLWWATASSGNFQIGNYVQNLWSTISPNRQRSENYNGAVDSFSMLICALASFGIGFVRVNWSKNGELLLFLVDIVLGGLMVVMSQTNDIWVGYGCYLVVRIIFQTTLTIATYQVAVHLSSRCYGLVFGLNTFLALIFETIMTIIVVDKNGLDLDVRKQFVVYGGYFGVLSLLFLTKFFYNCCQTNNSETVVSEAVES